ncbi:helix-turn-helix domain-containing protein [Aeromonas caviae]|uniref:HTH cro/C1-type domain-containing protein n=1 Tax=Aeromonas caviae TaxID=648 RepID=A0AA37D5G8_AERCA|nr:helix-turn-helix transcriptional regulator [Aeromonas caviae]GJA21240.1 hypothetical protein KAM336_42610 [Aeromonas caviae]GJA30121.1 hypothetical protein KAM340_42880 [Aeromonas caviae]GJA65837.1 hypothetical protein KAM351_44480 [Aeromonas caviae]
MKKNEEDTIGKTTCYTTVLGLVLREQREQRGLSQLQMAESVGMTSVGWGKLEKGVSALSVENLACAASTLGIKASALLDLVEALSAELEAQGWTVEAKRVENDALIAGWEMSKTLSSVGGMLAAGAVVGALAYNYRSDIMNKATQGFDAIRALMKDK